MEGWGHLDIHTDVRTVKEIIKNTKIMLERWNLNEALDIEEL